MGKVRFAGGGGFADLDVITATASDMLKGKIGVDKDGDPVIGEIESMSGGTYNATQADQTISCKDKYMTSNIILRALNVQSVLSFSATPGTAPSIVFSWKNPAKGPFSGVIIVGKTGGFPANISDGTRYYKGTGNNTAANGTSTTTITGFIGGTTYYFRCFSYAIKENAEWVASTTYTANATVNKVKGSQTFTSSGTFTVPAGVSSIDVFLVGGGGGGDIGENSRITDEPPYYSGPGGGGGYTITQKGVSVTPGEKCSVVIGAGGTQGYVTIPSNGTYKTSAPKDGGKSTFTSKSTTLTANGGEAAGWGGGAGGSGGGGNAEYKSSSGANGGSNGSDGGTTDGTTGGKGQGTTTRAFGESSNTLYSGGGGGGAGYVEYYTSDGDDYYPTPGTGGSGGGGTGAGNNKMAVAGTANTGGGGGGGVARAGTMMTTIGSGAAGGSGICIIRYGY